ncbi:unnamed protein product [Vitrella brassicaformis CCMP3155]|uniref:Uncharacterized protein n=1 Tax=Vitrella brassicaformis (strain CCMP3155) TaxID=1169540 RepID=A0A0G4F223_VITBC|nr:unnamed protein product [Vitrella brassicaformis CCMP3155]|eukprot:CEM05579.1 unnamed protein product [Vitrella brassicaformis CCMP3155]
MIVAVTPMPSYQAQPPPRLPVTQSVTYVPTAASGLQYVSTMTPPATPSSRHGTQSLWTTTTTASSGGPAPERMVQKTMSVSGSKPYFGGEPVGLTLLYRPDDLCEGNEYRVDLASFLAHVEARWCSWDSIEVGSVPGGYKCLDGGGPAHMGIYLKNHSKRDGAFFLDKAAKGNPEGLRVYHWPDGAAPEEESLFRHIYPAPYGCPERLLATLKWHQGIQFHAILANCYHFERDVRAAAMARDRVESVNTFFTISGDIARRLCCCQ